MIQSARRLILQRSSVVAATSAIITRRARRTTISSGAPSAVSSRCFSSSVKDRLEQQKQLLYMWGSDTAGSLWKPANRMDETVFDVPFAVEEEETTKLGRLRKVVCGPTDTAVITESGQCFVTGENKSGQLGLGHKNPVPQPTKVTVPSEHPEQTTTTTVQDVALGPTFAAFVDSVGDLYTAGFGGSAFAGWGCLGHGDGDERTTPTLVTSLVEDGCTVKQVTVGESHMTVLTTEGEVLTTGSGSYGRLGNFDTVDQLYLEPVELLTTETGITDIAGGKSFTLALASNGVIYGWGRNHKGQLGIGLGLAVDMYAMQAVPEPIQTDELINRKVVKIAAGHSHAAAITDKGELFFWGMTLHLEPVRVDALLHTKIVDVTCGQDYTLAIDETGRMYSFGKAGKTGVLGQGSVRRLNQPTLMEAFETTGGDDDDDDDDDQSKRKKKVVMQASAGWKHAACLVEEKVA